VIVYHKLGINNKIKLLKLQFSTLPCFTQRSEKYVVQI